MKINSINKERIEDIYLHDSIYSGYTYDYSRRQIHLSCRNSWTKKQHDFLFENVIYCSMQSCSFWHGGNSIMSISLDEQPIQMAELISIQNEHKDLYENSFLDRGITYIALRIEINSGDTLLIMLYDGAIGAAAGAVGGPGSGSKHLTNLGKQTVSRTRKVNPQWCQSGCQ